MKISEKNYASVLRRIEKLSNATKPKDIKELLYLNHIIEKYEDMYYPINLK